MERNLNAGLVFFKFETDASCHATIGGKRPSD
jgi:hypothetical protein